MDADHSHVETGMLNETIRLHRRSVITTTDNPKAKPISQMARNHVFMVVVGAEIPQD